LIKGAPMSRPYLDWVHAMRGASNGIDQCPRKLSCIELGT